MIRVVVGTDRGLHHLGGTVELADAQIEGVSGDWAVADGALWSRTADGWTRLEGSDRFTCVAATAAGAIAGISEAHLAEVSGGKVTTIAAFEDAPTRDAWHTPWGGPPDVRSIAVAHDGTPYVNVHVGGIIRGDDDGWHDTIDLHTDVHQVITHDDLVLAALGAGGMAVSDDRGETWHHRTAGLHAAYCRAVAVAGDTVIVSASSGPGGGRSAVYRAPLRGDAPFERCSDGLPEWFDRNIDSHCLAAHGDIVAFGTHDGRVFHSHDAGATWGLLLEGLPPVRCIDLSV